MWMHVRTRSVTSIDHCRTRRSMLVIHSHLMRWKIKWLLLHWTVQPPVRIPVTPWDTRTPVSARLLCKTTFYDLIHDHAVRLQLCDAHIYAHIANIIAYAITTSLMYITHLMHTYNTHRHWHADKHNMVLCWTAYLCTTRKQPSCAVNFSKCSGK